MELIQLLVVHSSIEHVIVEEWVRQDPFLLNFVAGLFCRKKFLELFNSLSFIRF